jgi:Mrp family chromosome partitioning ATPase
VITEEPRVLFRVPDASPPEPQLAQSEHPPVLVEEPQSVETYLPDENLPEHRDFHSEDSAYTPDPVQLVEAIQESIIAAQAEPPIVERAPPIASAQEPVEPGISAEPVRPQPTSEERKLLSVLSDPVQSSPYQQLQAAVARDTSVSSAPVVAIVGLDERFETGQVAAALATLLAKAQRTLLIEANPERDLSRMYGTPDATGLSESLAGRADRHAVVAATSQERLHLLPFGQASAEQAHLLPQGLGIEIAELRTSHAATVVDAGAISSSWALATSQAADAVYLIIRLGKTTTESAASTVQRFRAAGGKLTGCIAIE